jgi:hypothetical protein
MRGRPKELRHPLSLAPGDHIRYANGENQIVRSVSIVRGSSVDVAITHTDDSFRVVYAGAEIEIVNRPIAKESSASYIDWREVSDRF